MLKGIQNIPLWVILGIPVSILVFAFWWDVERSNIDISKWDTGVGKITHANFGRGSRSEMEYEYHGRQYNCAGKISCAGNVGEKYVIRINPKNPKEYIPLSWLPTFEDDEETFEATGKVIRVNKTWTSSKYGPRYALDYTFMRNGTEYAATQYLPPSYKNGTIKVGQQYLVQFGKGSPPRSIIHLDMAVKNRN